MAIEDRLRTLSVESAKRVADVSRSRRAFARGGVALDPATVEAEERARLGIDLAEKLRREDRAEDVAFRGEQQEEIERANRAIESENRRRTQAFAFEAFETRRQQEKIAKSKLSLGQRISNRVISFFAGLF